MPHGYIVLYALAVIFTLALTALTLTQAAADTLELSGKTVAVLGIVAGVLGTAQGFLPRVNRPPNEEREGMD